MTFCFCGSIPSSCYCQLHRKYRTSGYGTEKYSRYSVRRDEEASLKTRAGAARGAITFDHRNEIEGSDPTVYLHCIIRSISYMYSYFEYTTRAVLQYPYRNIRMLSAFEPAIDLLVPCMCPRSAAGAGRRWARADLTYNLLYPSYARTTRLELQYEYVRIPSGCCVRAGSLCYSTMLRGALSPECHEWKAGRHITDNTTDRAAARWPTRMTCSWLPSATPHGRCKAVCKDVLPPAHPHRHRRCQACYRAARQVQAQAVVLAPPPAPPPPDWAPLEQPAPAPARSPCTTEEHSIRRDEEILDMFIVASAATSFANLLRCLAGTRTVLLVHTRGSSASTRAHSAVLQSPE